MTSMALTDCNFTCITSWLHPYQPKVTKLREVRRMWGARGRENGGAGGNDTIMCSPLTFCVPFCLDLRTKCHPVYPMVLWVPFFTTQGPPCRLLFTFHPSDHFLHRPRASHSSVSWNLFCEVQLLDIFHFGAMFGSIWCQGTFSLLGKCIAPSSGAEEKGQQECKSQQDLSLLTNFVGTINFGARLWRE